MSNTEAIKPTLAEVVWPANGRAIRAIILMVVGSLSIWAAAKIQVPFYPVPMTLSTFAVLAIGMAYGWRLGAATLLLYMAEGAAGLPVFAGTPEKGIGLLYMVGPTGGYLLGYLCAATLCGWLAERGWDRNVWRAGLAMILGSIVLYVPGLLWLGVLFGWDKPLLSWGLYPFVLGDLVKLSLAALLLPCIWQLIGRHKRG